MKRFQCLHFSSLHLCNINALTNRGGKEIQGARKEGYFFFKIFNHKV